MTTTLKRTEGAIKAEARQRAFSVLRKAWKRRSAEGFTANELAAILGRDKAQVSRVLNGHSPTMTLETLALFLDGMGYQLRIDCEAEEEVVVFNNGAVDALERGKVA
jgi:transcriptional regulator with XRE-family HTH domain